jgi:arylsulfatase A-like enzyme
VVTDLVQHVDLLPTLLAAVNLPADPDLPGRDLTPALRGAPLAPAPSFAEGWAGRVHHASVRSGDWKLLRAGAAPAQLYDLGTDPSESRDVAAEHPETLARLEGILAAYFSAGAAGDVAGVDWEAAAGSGLLWTPGARPTSAPVEPSDGTLEALEALGYLDAEDEAEN